MDPSPPAHSNAGATFYDKRYHLRTRDFKPKCPQYYRPVTFFPNVTRRPRGRWRGQGRGRCGQGRGYYRQRQYYSNPPPVPPPPLFPGSDEYTTLKIQEISSKIQEKLQEPIQSRTFTIVPIQDNPVVVESSLLPVKSKKPCKSSQKSTSNHVEESTSNNTTSAKEIYAKIVDYITNFSQRRRQSFIENPSGQCYNDVIDDIQRRKRLELSAALRAVRNHIEVTSESHDEQKSDVTEDTYNILPDIGIDLNSLPLEVVREISRLFPDDLELQVAVADPTITRHCPLPNNNAEMDDSNHSEFIADPWSLLSESAKELRHSVDTFKTAPVLYPEVKLEVLDGHIYEHVDDDNDENLDRGQPPLVNGSEEAHFDQFYNHHVAMIDEIDLEVTRLTQLRSLLVASLKRYNNLPQRSLEPINESTVSASVSSTKPFEGCTMGQKIVATITDEESHCTRIDEAISVLKSIPEYIVAASQRGKLFFIDATTFNISFVVRITKLPIISMHYYDINGQLYIGSVNNLIIVYNVTYRRFVDPIEVMGRAACLEIKWNYLFGGTSSGHVIRYNLQKSCVEFEEKICTNQVSRMVATQEGARKVLLTSQCQEPVISIRDAISGLLMRTICVDSEILFSFTLDENLIYSATNGSYILVHSFHEGRLTGQYKVKYRMNSSSCLSIVNRILYVSSNNHVSLFDLRSNGTCLGHLNMRSYGIISMVVHNEHVLVGTSLSQFCCLDASKYVVR